MNTNIINSVAEVPAVQRTISAWQQGKPRKDFQSSATTYGQLKRELIDHGYDLKDTMVTEGNTKLTLANDDAILPINIAKGDGFTNNLVIMMTPQKKIKSGSDWAKASYKECKAEIKALCNGSKWEKDARAFFGNYTQMSTALMQSKLVEWEKGYQPVATKPHVAKAAKTAKMIADANGAMETGTFAPVNVPQSDLKARLNQALNTIYAGTQLLQVLIGEQDTDTPSDSEIQAMLKSIK